MRVRRVLVVVMALGLLLGGCARESHMVAPMPFEKGAPVVYIRPLVNAYRQAKVGVLPFQVPANMGQEQSMGVAALFKDVLLGKRTYPTVKQLAAPYSDYESAVALGRRAGVDLVLAGRVDYALDGSDFGGARVAVSVRLLDTKTGNTVWYVTQAIDQAMEYPDTSIVHRLATSFTVPAYHSSNGPPAVPNMLARIAVDMGEVFSGARYVARR